MTFESPQCLWLLLVLPLLTGFYVLLQRRRTRAAVRYASLALIREALGPRARLRRHIPPLLFLLALGALFVAMARPSAMITLPSEQRTIILAIDVSLSMRATDVEPSRIAAAREAAKTFVQDQPSDVRIGIVAFAGSASIVQKPTAERSELIDAIDRLQLQLHTAIGSGIIVSLAALFPEDAAELEAANTTVRWGRDGPRGAPIDKPKAESKKDWKPVPPGSNHSGAIILLTDGRRTTGPDPLDAAKLAADRGIKVYTVGFGNSQGTTADVDGMSIYMRFDEEALKAIAQATAADYFHAGSGADLKKVYETLNARYVLEKKQTEISALLCAIGAVLVVIAAGLSVLWFGRIGASELQSGRAGAAAPGRR
jgi:Ca-activated chloride channel homolog